MKQLWLFEEQKNSQEFSQKIQEINRWKLFIDGGARNNPGPAGAGICIIKNEQPFFKAGIFLGLKTNNQAEYLALIYGLYVINKEIAAHDLLLVISDSQLLVRQIQGLYKVKEPHLKPLFTLGLHMLNQRTFAIAHVMREENSEADEQANLAIDHKIKAPDDFAHLLHQHEIHL